MEAGLTLAGEGWRFGGEQSVVGDEEPDDRDVEVVRQCQIYRAHVYYCAGTQHTGRADVCRRGMGVGNMEAPGLGGCSCLMFGGATRLGDCHGRILKRDNLVPSPGRAAAV